MLATEILTRDHREALALIEEIQNVRSAAASHDRTFEQLRAALELHMREEEEIFYPALAEHEDFSDLLEENVPEHEMVREMLAQLSELDPNDALFQETLLGMKAALETHMTLEEEDLFPDAIDTFGAERINELGNRIDQLKGDAGLSRVASM
jgi:iron-sulfur cluster repair protein YtfE (RIC family)